MLSSSSPSEGYVVRVAGAFPMSQFDRHVAKFVRKGHVQTDKDWMHEKVVPNKRRVATRYIDTLRIRAPI